jgi:hypothetical protein
LKGFFFYYNYPTIFNPSCFYNSDIFKFEKIIIMPEICYKCGVKLNSENSSKEHVPARNLYDDLDDSFKRDRITVPACKKCNGEYSKIDQEIRDLLVVKNADPENRSEFTRKGFKSILRRSNWKDRVLVDEDGKSIAVTFSYEDLREIHIKNFRALFYRKYGIRIPDDFVIEIIADGDDNLIEAAQMLEAYIKDGKEWEVSGHADVFKFILKDITENAESGQIEESGDFDKIVGVAGLFLYDSDTIAIVVAGKKEYVETCKPQ